MINPSPTAMLRTVLASLESVLLPGLVAKLEAATPDSVSADKLNLSTAITIGHMLRHTLVRLEREDGQFRAERVLLMPLIAGSRALLAAHPDETSQALIRAIDDETAKSDEAVGPTALSDELGAKRLLVQDILTWLQRRRSALGSDAGYRRLRDEIRRYMAFQINCEAELIDEAMAGPRHRR